MLAIIKNYKTLFSSLLISNFAGSDQLKVEDLIKEDPTSNKDEEIKNRLNEIKKLFDESIEEDTAIDLGTTKDKIIKKWLGNDVQNLNDGGLVDKQVNELFNLMKLEITSKTEVQDSTISLLDKIKNDISSRLNIINGEKIDDDIADSKLSDFDFLTITNSTNNEFLSKKEEKKQAELDKALDKALEKAASEKAASEKAASEKATSEKATSEKATSEKATSEKDKQRIESKPEVKNESKKIDIKEQERKSRVNKLIGENRDLVKNSGDENLKKEFSNLTKPGKTTHEEMNSFQNTLLAYKENKLKTLFKDKDKNAEDKSEKAVVEKGENVKNETKKEEKDKTVLDNISEKYENIKTWVSEIFEQNEELRVIDLGNGDKITAEYNKSENKIEIDTQFFDGVFDYNLENIPKNINSKEEAKKYVENTIDNIKKDYLQKVNDTKSDIKKTDSKEAEKTKDYSFNLKVGDKESLQILLDGLVEGAEGNHKANIGTYGEGKDIKKYEGQINVYKIFGKYKLEVTSGSIFTGNPDMEINGAKDINPENIKKLLSQLEK